MRSRLGSVLRLLVSLSAAAAVVDATLFAVAFVALRNGPSPVGYGFLQHATQLVLLVTALACVASATAAFTRRGSMWGHGSVMLLSGGFTAGIALGLVGIGSVLNSSAADVSMDVESLILAVRGVGQQIWPVPLMLAVSGLVVWASPSIRLAIRRPTRRAIR